MDTFDIASFNLHCHKNDPVKRVKILARELAKKDFDVIALQEVCVTPDLNIKKLLINELFKNSYYVRSQNSVFTHMSWGIYEEELFILSKHKASDQDYGDLPTSPLNRSFVSLTIGEVNIVNTHLSHISSEYRRDQINFLVKKYKDTNSILVGDFNSSPTKVEHMGLHMNNFTPTFPGNTYPASRPTFIYDGFWQSQAIAKKFQTIDQGLLFNQRFEGYYLSDHLGVYAKLSK